MCVVHEVGFDRSSVFQVTLHEAKLAFELCVLFSRPFIQLYSAVYIVSWEDAYIPAKNG